MTMAISTAVERGAKVVVCASTGNTSASAAAYAARAGVGCAVVLPEGHVALGQARAGADPRRPGRADPRQLRRRARIVRELGERPGDRGRQLGEPVPHRRSEDGRVRDRRHARRRARPCTASRSGTRATSPRTGGATSSTTSSAARRARRGCSAGRRRARRRSCSASRCRTRRRSPPRSGSATRRRGRARSRRATSRAATSARSPTPRSSRPTGCSPSDEGCFVEPASAASVAGLLQAAADGRVAARRRRRVHGHRPRAQGPAARHQRGAGGRAGRRRRPTRSPWRSTSQ